MRTYYINKFCSSFKKWLLVIFLSIFLIQINNKSFSSHLDLANERPYPAPKHFIKLVCDEGGLFWSMINVIGVLKLYEEGYYVGVKVDFGSDQRYGIYHDPLRGSNWWNYYFEPIHVGDESLGPLFCTIHGNSKTSFGNLTEFHTCRQQCHELIKKYIHIRPHIQKKIDDFTAHNFKEHFIIGVHYRGTDKSNEAPRAAYDVVLDKLSRLINALETNILPEEIKIFVATDEQPFLEYLNSAYPGKIVFYDALRSTNGHAIHYSEKVQNYKKGEDAIIDCLLLSSCHLLVKTSSNLSLCSSYFNPDVPVFHLTSRPYFQPLEGFIDLDEAIQNFPLILTHFK